MTERIKIDPEKLTHVVRELYELSLVKNLSPLKLGPILGVSVQQIYRWYAGAAPKLGSEQQIKTACDKIRALPDHLIADKATWGRLWTRAESLAVKKREAAEKKFQAQMDRLFDHLKRKATAAEMATLLPDEDAWLSFEEIMSALKRHGIKLEKL